MAFVTATRGMGQFDRGEAFRAPHAAGCRPTDDPDRGTVIMCNQVAAELFAGHPYFMIFPGDSVEIMECLPLPRRRGSTASS